MSQSRPWSVIGCPSANKVFVVLVGLGAVTNPWRFLVWWQTILGNLFSFCSVPVEKGRRKDIKLLKVTNLFHQNKIFLLNFTYLKFKQALKNCQVICWQHCKSIAFKTFPLARAEAYCNKEMNRWINPMLKCDQNRLSWRLLPHKVYSCHTSNFINVNVTWTRLKIHP